LTAWGGNATQAELCCHLADRGIDPDGTAVIERPGFVFRTGLSPLLHAALDLLLEAKRVTFEKCSPFLLKDDDAAAEYRHKASCVPRLSQVAAHKLVVTRV
jgi:hypothetical protein